MTEQQMTCTLCGRGCPMDALSCDRGRRAAGQDETGERRTGHEGGEGHGEGCHGRHGEGHGCREGGHGRHGHGPCCREEGGDDLVSLLERSGRFLLHHGGASRGQTRILEILGERESMSQKDLQDLLGIQPGSMSEILAKLEGKGLLCRVRDEGDKRMVVVRITGEGREHLRRSQERPSEEQVFAALTPEEREQLRALLLKVQRSWHGGHHREHRGE